MQIGKGLLKMGPLQTLQVKDITPAEARILEKIWGPKADGPALSGVVITGEATDPNPDDMDAPPIPRTDESELERLRMRYQNTEVPVGKKSTINVVEHLYPGDNAELPQTFRQVRIEAVELPPAAAPKKAAVKAPPRASVPVAALKED